MILFRCNLMVSAYYVTALAKSDCSGKKLFLVLIQIVQAAL